MDYIATSSSRF